MIYTLTFNPSLDYIVRVKNFEAGKLNRVSYEKILPGGKGVNVSTVLGNLGHPNTALGFTAGFTGEALKAMLKEKKVVSDFIDIPEGMTRINVKMKSQQETEINGQGPAISDEHLQALYRRLDELESGDYLVISGSIPSSMPSDMYEIIMKRLQGRGINIIVDASQQLLVKVLKYHPFLIKPNHHELNEIFDAEVTRREEVKPYAEKLQQMGARNVLVSMGGQGAVLLSEDGQFEQTEAPAGKLVNSVGAGDSMVAGFLAGYLESGDYHRAFMMGVCSGSASAFSEELASRAEVEELLKQYEQ